MRIASCVFTSIAASLCVLAATPAARAQCVVGAPGGPFGATAGPGVWSAQLPTNPLESALNVTVPAGATVLNSIVVRGFVHTWAGDAHAVLRSPSGARYNVAVLADATSSSGNGCDDVLGGDFTFVDVRQGVGCGTLRGPVCGSLSAGGTVAQSFSSWTNGAGGVFNVPLELIPLANGLWTLELYDWFPPADNGAIASWEMCFGAPTPLPPQGAQLACASSATGAAIPAPGVEGTWPATLPTGVVSSSLNVVVPPGATRIRSVSVQNLTHSWLGDVQLVLTSPAGVNYNLFQQNDGFFGFGCAADFSGLYSFVDAAGGVDECGAPALAFNCPTGTLAPGFYRQFFGNWPSGAAGIVNVPLHSIPIASGVWTLKVYDWFAQFDNGAFTGWELCFDAPPPPLSYCTAGTSTAGCVPSLSSNAQPSATGQTTPVFLAVNVEGQKQAIMYYGLDNSGFTPTPWAPGSTSFRCLKSPTQRMTSQNTGSVAGSCGGQIVQDWNAFQLSQPAALGQPFLPGSKVYVQGWYRDAPAPKTTNLTNALELTVLP